MTSKRAKSATRTPEQLREHYEIEKELAARLRTASREERRTLYSSLYDEMFRRVPLHPQLTRKASEAETRLDVERQMRGLRSFLRPDSTYMEVGPGDCALAREVAKSVKRVYAVDVSDEITSSATMPDNFELILSDGCGVPVPPGVVDVAYSNQLMEHLHPDDASEQLKGILNSLVPGGCYLCTTPNRLTGPHDISLYFDEVATGFHLREYSVSELKALFESVGFTGFKAYLGARGVYVRFPVTVLTVTERSLGALPPRLGRAVAHSLPFRLMLNGIRLAGVR